MTVSGLAHSFPGTGELFGGLTFSLSTGDLVALTGPSGSGKSTLLAILAGWERPKRGTVALEDVGSVGWVFQNPFGVPNRLVIDHVMLPLLAHGVTRAAVQADALALLERFGLGNLEDRRYKDLSGGEAQRLMLARAVAKSPDLLLVDEPTAQLDPTAARAVNRVLGELAGNRIVVVATHDPQTAAGCPINIDLRKVSF